MPKRPSPSRPTRVFTIEDPVFKTEPLFVVGCSHATMAAYLHKRFGVEVAAEPEVHSGQMLTFEVEPWRVIWVRTWGSIGLPVALHELFHLVTRICQDKGIPIVAHHPNGDNGDEPAAYMYEFFARRVLRRFGVRWVED